MAQPKTVWFGWVSIAGYEYGVICETKTAVETALRKHYRQLVKTGQVYWDVVKAEPTTNDPNEYFGAHIREMTIGKVEDI